MSTVPSANQIGPLMTSACGNRFHLFAPHPTQLDMTCSLLCSNVFVNGPGVIYQVKFRSKAVPGATTTLAITPATTFYKAGFIMLPLGIQGMTLTITDVTGVGGERAPGRSSSRRSPIRLRASGSGPRLHAGRGGGGAPRPLRRGRAAGGWNRGPGVSCRSQ